MFKSSDSPKLVSGLGFQIELQWERDWNYPHLVQSMCYFLSYLSFLCILCMIFKSVQSSLERSRKDHWRGSPWRLRTIKIHGSKEWKSWFLTKNCIAIVFSEFGIKIFDFRPINRLKIIPHKHYWNFQHFDHSKNDKISFNQIDYLQNVLIKLVKQELYVYFRLKLMFGVLVRVTQLWDVKMSKGTRKAPIFFVFCNCQDLFYLS